MKLNYLKHTLVFLLAMSPLSTNAATTTATVNVAFKIINTPAVINVVGSLDFGAVSATSTANLAAQSTIDVTVANGLNYTIELDRGLYFGRGAPLRTLRFSSNQSPTGFIHYPYRITQDLGGQRPWGTLTTANRGLLGTGSPQRYTLYAWAAAPSMLPSFANVVGAGSDTVTITVTY